MQILNIGPLELIIALLIMFLLLGPKEMVLTAQRIGRWIRNFVRSPMWREIMGYSQEIRELPQKLMDDTGLKEALDDVKQTTQQTANELNSTVREAVQDARVPEAENLKIETGSGVLPGAKTARPEPVKAAPTAVSAKIEETQTIAPPGMGPEDIAGAADTAGAAEPAGAAETAVAADAAGAAKSAGAEDTTGAEEPGSAGIAEAAAEAEPPAPIVAAALPVVSRAPKALPAAVLQAAAVASSAAEAAAAASVAASTAAAQATAAASSAAEAAAAASAAVEAVAAAIAAAEAAVKEPPKPRRTRARKVDEAAGADVAPGVAQAEAEKLDAEKRRKTRTRVKTVSEVAPTAAQAEPEAGAADGEVTATPETEPEAVSAAALANQREVEALAAQIKALSGGANGAAVAVDAPVVSEAQAEPEVGGVPEAVSEQPQPRRTRARKVVGPAPELELADKTPAADGTARAEDAMDLPKPRRTRARKAVVAAPAAVQAEPENGGVDAEINATPEPEPDAVSAALANQSAVEALAAQVRSLSGDAGAPEAGNGAEPAPEQLKPRRSRARKVAAEVKPAAEEQLAAEEHVENQ